MRKSSVRAPKTTQSRQLNRTRELDGGCRGVVKPSFVTVRALIRRGSRALLRTTAPSGRAAATSFTKVYWNVAPHEPRGRGSPLCYSLHVQRETAFNVSAIKDTVLRSIKLNQQAYNNRDADVLREVYLEPMLSQVAHDLSGDFESFPAARLDITCEVLDVSYTAYLQIGKVELSPTAWRRARKMSTSRPKKSGSTASFPMPKRASAWGGEPPIVFSAITITRWSTSTDAGGSPTSNQPLRSGFLSQHPHASRRR